MKILCLAMVIVLTTAVSFENAKVCGCSQLSFESDCNGNRECKWDGPTKSCIAKFCADPSMKSFCETVPGCALTNAGVCAAFVKCADYTVPQVGMCNSKNAKCTEGAKVGTSYPCVEGAYKRTCASILTEINCNGIEDSTKNQCYWESAPHTGSPVCVSAKMTACTDANGNEHLCKSHPECIFSAPAYVAQQCQLKKCTDIKDQASCTSVATQFNGTTHTLCKWDSKCIDAPETTYAGLTSYNCYTSTLNTASWDQTTKSCKVCNTGSAPKATSFSSLQSALIVAILALSFM